MIPKPTNNPQTDHMDWNWVIENGIASTESNEVTLIGADCEGYNIYDLDYKVQINSIVEGEGVEWYFCPLGDAACDYDELDRFALKLNQSYLLNEASFRSAYRRASKRMEIFDISWWYTSSPEYFIVEPTSADAIVGRHDMFDKDYQCDIKTEAKWSEKTQRSASKLDAAPDVGCPCIVRGKKQIWFIGLDKDGQPIRHEDVVDAWWYGYETCIAERDSLCEQAQLSEDYEELENQAYHIADDLAMTVYRFLDGDIQVPKDYGDDWKNTGVLFEGQECSITYEQLVADCHELAVQYASATCRDTDYIDELEGELCEIATMVLDNYLEGYRDDAFKRIEHDIDTDAMINALRTHSPELDSLRERLTTVGAGDDLHQNNLGYFNGELVCIDFGKCSST